MCVGSMISFSKETQAMIKTRICCVAVLASVFSSVVLGADAKPNFV